jgi:hypothetical protein
VPWCAQCDRFLSPPTVRPDGSCPTCGAAVDPEGGRGRRLKRLPWHVKLVLGVLAVYLAFRVVQGIVWLSGQI